MPGDGANFYWTHKVTIPHHCTHALCISFQHSLLKWQLTHHKLQHQNDTAFVMNQLVRQKEYS